MAKKYWKGGAGAVAQISTIQITANDTATTYEVTIGGVTVSVPGNAGGVNSTATDLQVALAASTDPYFSAITWTVATDTVTGTAAVAGVPFVATTSVTGGTGTIGAPSTTTASAGPNDWSTADNWSDGIVPATGDTVILADSAVNISWGLDQNAITLTELRIEQTYTGKLGLARSVFATSSDADTTDATATEYRQDYLKAGVTTLTIGQHLGPGNSAGSGRLKIDNVKTGASTTTIHNTGTGVEANLPAVRLLAANAGADLYVRNAPGGVGVAVDEPGETSTIGSVVISDITQVSRVFLSDGVTITTWQQAGGDNVLQAAATVTTVDVDGGVLLTDGDFGITTCNVTGGILHPHNAPATGNAIGTLNLTGGTVDATGSGASRTWGTVNPDGGALKLDDAAVTITTLDTPAGRQELQVVGL